MCLFESLTFSALLMRFALWLIPASREIKDRPHDSAGPIYPPVDFLDLDHELIDGVNKSGFK